MVLSSRISVHHLWNKNMSCYFIWVDNFHKFHLYSCACPFRRKPTWKMLTTLIIIKRHENVNTQRFFFYHLHNYPFVEIILMEILSICRNNTNGNFIFDLNSLYYQHLPQVFAYNITYNFFFQYLDCNISSCNEWFGVPFLYKKSPYQSTIFSSNSLRHLSHEVIVELESIFRKERMRRPKTPILCPWVNIPTK